MHIHREIKEDIQKNLSLKKAKIIVIYGARKVGKTTLVEEILEKNNQKILKLNGDEETTARLFS